MIRGELPVRVDQVIVEFGRATLQKHKIYD